MNCREFDTQLDGWIDGRLEPGLRLDCEAHLGACATCQVRLEMASALRLRLRRLAAPPLPLTLAPRLFTRIRETERRAAGFRITNRPWAAAGLAASLLLGVGIALQLFGVPVVENLGRPFVATTTEPVVLADPGQVQPVRLMFRSPRDLAGVTVHLQLPEGVELANRPGLRELSWQTDLQSGANVLELPVVIQRGEGGRLTARLSLGQGGRDFSVQVRTRTAATPSASAPGFQST